MRTGCDYTLQMCTGQLLLIDSSSHQPPSAPSDQRSCVLNIREECGAACNRDLGHEEGYTKPSQIASYHENVPIVTLKGNGMDSNGTDNILIYQ